MDREFCLMRAGLLPSWVTPFLSDLSIQGTQASNVTPTLLLGTPWWHDKTSLLVTATTGRVCPA